MIQISETAARKIRTLMAKQGIDEGGLRVGVKGGGCSGLSYTFAWERVARLGDEVFEGVEGAKIFVDYAHAPDGIETVLAALRPHVAGRLAVVFGAGGDRDPGKRPLMGEAADRNADIVVVTDDNPRTEDAAKIRRQVLVGCPDATEIGDRATAIRETVALLEPDDVLVVAGKGHEQGQIVGTKIIPFDDATVSRDAVEEIERAQGALA